MKLWIVLGLIAIFIIVGGVRYYSNENDRMDNERHLWVRNLNYAFAAKIDSIHLYEKGSGDLYIGEIVGRFNKFTEDSLNRQLANYKWIRFVNRLPSNQFKIFFWHAVEYPQMDSISVNSNDDRIEFFKNGCLVLESKISNEIRYKVRFAFWIKD